jgi:hypothetical protein
MIASLGSADSKIAVPSARTVFQRRKIIAWSVLSAMGNLTSNPRRILSGGSFIANHRCN